MCTVYKIALFNPIVDVATTPNSASGEDVFGDFLSSSSSLSSNNEAQHPGTASSSLGTVAMTSSQLQQQSANDVDKSAVMSGTTAALSSSSILPGGGIAEKPKDSVKGLLNLNLLRNGLLWHIAIVLLHLDLCLKFEA